MSDLYAASTSDSQFVTVPHGTVTVVYQQKDITAAITPYLISFEYIDQIGGAADSLELRLEDAELRWQDAWYPGFGDQLTASMGYAGQQLLPCGTFEIDEIELEGPPDVVTVKALGAGVKRAVRSRRGRAYENTTLSAIAATVARRNKLTLKGTIEAIHITRVTQAFETDLAFLHRVAREYGYEFSVRGSLMTFYKRSDLKSAPVIATFTRGDLNIINYHFHDKIHEIYVASTVSYHNAHHKKLHKKRVVDPAATLSQYDHYSVDELNLNVRAENDTQANLKANAALERANDDQTLMSLDVYGNQKLAAGINVAIAGFGKLSGKYTITQSTHRYSRDGGYKTSVEMKRVREAADGAQ
ncbi:Cro/Cl family transcriptional regulator [Burkholderia cenocepacia]|uniref:phage late control D family protein n=1 Tax=Burkholderia cenocepacia TaxID=95486 RepID=UPI001AA15849|nr:contractile injection system protein, VgrG/Pvc8 family [Burkholderia cenocepacia]MBO1856855.1 Cro/Cl family transcriptional regulator [Burkholderia cenocepacia]